jgi:hypothetical protein
MPSRRTFSAHFEERAMNRSTIARMALGPIRQVSAEVHIAFDKLRIAHHDLRCGMS